MSALFLYRCTLPLDTQQRDVLLAYLAADALDDAEFSSAITEEVERNLLPDEIIILIRHSALRDIEEQFKTSATLATLGGRIGPRTLVTVIGFGVDGKETKRISVLDGAATSKVDLNAIKTRAMMHIFVTRGGFIEATPGYHFAVPSGRHTDRFIRLSNILVRGAEISFLALCTLPLIPVEARTAYVDTPALFGVVGAINELWRSLDPSRLALHADNFGSWGGFATFRFSTGEDAVVLISASSSGTLARHLRDEHGFADHQIVHVLFLGADADNMQVVCNLEQSPENPAGYASPPVNYQPGQCALCDAGSFAIGLAGYQFDIPGPQHDALMIVRSDAPPDLGGLMARLAAHKILRVGFGSAHGKWPRQFEIDVAALMQSDSFRERLDYIIKKEVPAALNCVIVLDPGSKDLATKVAAACGQNSSPRIVSKDDLPKIDSSGTTSPVVIVAAAIESGRSLQDISRDLRSVFPNAPQSYLVGFAKTASAARYTTLEDTLVQTWAPVRHGFSSVERMILPASSDPHAWLAELRLLNDPSFREKADNSGSDWNKRRDRLSKTAEAMIDELFVANTSDEHLRLQPGFVFWPENISCDGISQADVFFTIASVLQNLRSNAERPGARALRGGRFQQTLLAPGNFGRFSDGVIQASLLRAARPHELNYATLPEHSREMSRIVRRIIENANRPRGEAATEFLIALATKRLQLCGEDHQVVFADVPNAPTRVRMLLEICRDVL